MMRHDDGQRRVWRRLSVGLAIIAISGCATTQRQTEIHQEPVITAPAEPQPEAWSLLGRPLFGPPPDADPALLEQDLDAARLGLAHNPEDLDRLIWVGRRLGYLWRMNEAIELYTQGLQQFPDHPALYRHRGHRYISVRRFADAIADFEKAAALIADRSDEIEMDGRPNERNIPLTSLGFNIWYHLGVARFVSGDFEGARRAFETTMRYSGGWDDNLVAVSDWLYMALRRLGRDEEAAALLEPIHEDMEIIENDAYYRRLLMYKGLIPVRDLMDIDDAVELDYATMGYGLGHWYLLEGDRDRAMQIFRNIVLGPYWPAFGFIAAEADLQRLMDEAEAEIAPARP